MAALERGLAPLDPLLLAGEEITGTGLSGDREPSGRFGRRRPDVLAVPREGFAWDDDDGHPSNAGMHGGLQEDEILGPFAAATVADQQG
ncbi:MAG: hypothetical protein V5A61_05585 [Haloarculaceae archaeon]